MIIVFSHVPCVLYMHTHSEHHHQVSVLRTLQTEIQVAYALQLHYRKSEFTMTRKLE